MIKPKLLILGFILFLLGMVSLILSLIGINLIFLEWLDWAGEGLGAFFKLTAAVLGILLIFISNTDFEKENQEQ